MRRESIVGIPRQGSNEFVGCGFAVTPRHILTCAHVVKAAFNSVNDSRNILLGEVISVCFPYLNNKQVKAKIVYWKPDVHDIKQLPSVYEGIEEDIAGLELVDEIPDVKPVEVRTYSENIEFKALGYPKKATQGAVAQGTIQAAIPFGWVQIDGNRQNGFWVAPGYSGTPLWNLQNGKDVYGMMVAVRKDDDMAHKIAYMIPYERLKKAIAFLKLLNILPQLKSLDNQDELWSVYQTVYEQCKPPDWNLAMPMPETPSDFVAQVNDMSQSDLKISEKTVERTWEFVARFLTHPRLFLAESEKQKLRDWGSKEFSKFSTLIDVLGAQTKIQPARKQAVADPCLMLEVSPNHSPYSTRAFFIPDSQTYDANNYETWKEIFCWDFTQKREGINDLEPFDSNVDSELKARLSGYIKTCFENYPSRKFRLELILPLSLMNQPLECLKLEFPGCYESILIPGSNFPMVVRSYDRTTQEYQKELGVQWEEKWKKLENHIRTVAYQCLADVPANIQVHQLTATYQANPKTIGFKLSEVLQTSLQEKFLGALLGSAAPVAVWLRHIPNSLTTDENPVQKYLNEFLQCDSPCEIGELLARAQQVRATAISNSSEPDDKKFMVGNHLSLLWENPKLLPPLAPKYVSE